LNPDARSFSCALSARTLPLLFFTHSTTSGGYASISSGRAAPGSIGRGA